MSRRIISVGNCILALFVFFYDFGIKDKLFGVIIQRFSRVIEFTLVDLLYVDEFPNLCDELAGPF